ncbi:MAG: MBL fold metallo-hydrolase [Dehalococcoidales bacterium]|nr:MAG: MBL fold metallo-hydrolase [Dehalococcoidales bacterium]
MELKKISDRIYYLPAEERTDRPILGYIRGDNYSLAVDAGNSSDHIEKLYRELRDLGPRLPDFTVITHWHWDHSFGMHSVSGTTLASHPTNEKLAEVQQWEWTDEAMKKRLQSGEEIDFCDQCIRLEYPDRSKIKVVTAEIEFNGSITFDLGGVSCEIREFTSPHSIDSVLIYVPKERIVFIGDAESGDYYQNNGEYDRAKLTEMIIVLEKIDVDTIMPGHDGPQPKAAVMNFLKNEFDRLSIYDLKIPGGDEND